MEGQVNLNYVLSGVLFDEVQLANGHLHYVVLGFSQSIASEQSLSSVPDLKSFFLAETLVEASLVNLMVGHPPIELGGSNQVGSVDDNFRGD